MQSVSLQHIIDLICYSSASSSFPQGLPLHRDTWWIAAPYVHDWGNPGHCEVRVDIVVDTPGSESFSIARQCHHHSPHPKSLVRRAPASPFYGFAGPLREHVSVSHFRLEGSWWRWSPISSMAVVPTKKSLRVPRARGQTGCRPRP